MDDVQAYQRTGGSEKAIFELAGEFEADVTVQIL